MILFYFLIFVMPLAKHRIWGHIAGDFTGIKYLGMVCFPYALFHIAVRRSLPAFFATWQARLFLIFYGIATFSYFGLGRMRWMFSHWLSYSSFVVLFFITLMVVDSASRVRWVVLSGIGSLGLASLYVLRDWQVSHSIYPDYRPGWIVGDPNYFTVNALIFLPAALLLMREKQLRWQRWFCLGCVVLTLAAVMFSASRGGFLGLIAAFVFLLLRSRHRLRNLILISASFFVLSLPLAISPVGRFLHPTQSDDEAVDTRKALWLGGARIISVHPILGVGLDNYAFVVADYIKPEERPTYERIYRVAHNSYIEIAAEMGLPALLSFVSILFFSIRTLEKMQRQTQGAEQLFLHQVALALESGLIGGTVAIFFVSGEYQKLLWLAIFLSMCLPSLVRREPALVGEPSGFQPHSSFAAVSSSSGQSPRWTRNTTPADAAARSLTKTLG